MINESSPKNKVKQAFLNRASLKVDKIHTNNVLSSIDASMTKNGSFTLKSDDSRQAILEIGHFKTAGDSMSDTRQTNLSNKLGMSYGFND